MRSELPALRLDRGEEDLAMSAHDDADDPRDNEVYRWIQDVATRKRTREELAQAPRDRSL